MSEYRIGNYNLPMQAEQIPCQVCFTDSRNDLPHNKIVHCQECRLPVHAYCYSPKKMPFTCDNCRWKYKGNCKLCTRPGMQKKFGQHFAHPLCLFMDSGAIVSNYGQLVFEDITCQRSSVKQKCSECGAHSSNVVSCASKGCNKKCHIYCACRGGQAQGWKVLTQPLDQAKTYYDAYSNAFLRTIRSRNKFLAGQLGLKKSLKTRDIHMLVFCSDHGDTVIQCLCKQWDQLRSDWVYCEGCCRWLHMDCLSLTTYQRQTLDGNSYICPQCISWKSWTQNPSGNMPEILPKFQLYDYIYLNALAEEQKEKTSEKVLQLLTRIPITPGLAFGQCFFRKDIFKMLKAKINLGDFRTKIIGKDIKQTAKYLQKERDRLELMWLLVDGSLFQSKNNQAFPHLIQDQDQESFLENNFQLLIKFEEKYAPGPSATFQKAFKNVKEMPDKKQQGKKLQNEQEWESSSLTIDGQSVGRERKNIPHQIKRIVDINQQRKVQDTSESKEEIREKELKSSEQQLQKLIIEFQKASANDGKGIGNIFEQLYKLIKKAKLQQYIDPMPQNSLKKALSFKTAALGTSFVQYMGTFNYFQEAWKDFVSKQQRLPSTAQIQTIESYQWRAASLRQSIYYIEDEDLQNEVLAQLFARQSDAKIATGFQLFKQCDKLEWYHEYDQIPEQLLNIKQLKAEIQLKKINDEYPQKLYTALIVLEQLKQANFNQTTRNSIFQLRQILLKQASNQRDIISILENFLVLYDATKHFVEKIGNRETYSQRCLFEELSFIKIFNKLISQSNENNFLEYLDSIKTVKISHFNLQIQKTLKQKISSYVDIIEKRKKIFISDKQIKIVRKWVQRFRIYSPRVNKALEADRKASNKLMFTRLNFQDYISIMQIEKSLQESKEIYKEQNIEFRSSKVQRLLEWIKVYKLVLDQTPLEYLMKRQQWIKTTYKIKPSLQILRKLLDLLVYLEFPDGTFKSNLKEAVEQTQMVKNEFKNINKLCNWNNSHNSQENKQKIPLNQVANLVQRAKQCPLGLQIQIIQYEIVLKKYDQAEQKAQKLLKKDAEYDSTAMLDTLKILEAGPIFSQYIQLLKKALKNQWNNEDKQKEKLFDEIITPSDKKPSYQTVFQLRNYFKDSYRGSLNTQECIQTLDQMLEIVNQCYERFSNQINLFNSKDGKFSEEQIKHLEELQEGYKKSKLRDNALDRLCIEFKKYQVSRSEFARISLNLFEQIQVTEEEIQNYETLLTILHPCFYDENLKRNSGVKVYQE